jgi:hypothetical protein
MTTTNIITWSFDNTISTKYLGREYSLYLYSLVGVPIFVISMILTFLVFGIVQALCILMVLDWIPQVISTFFLCLLTFIFFVTHVDVEIAKRILLTFTPVVNLALISVGLINFALTMNHFDYRGQFGIPCFLGTLFVVLLDSYPHHAKATLTIPSLILIVGVNTTIVVLLALRRYPLYLDYTYDLGDIGGLATAPITYSARELASSTIFANFILCIRMLLLSVWHRHSTVLTSLTTPVKGTTSEEDDIIFKQIFNQQYGIAAYRCFKRRNKIAGGSSTSTSIVNLPEQSTSGMIVKVEEQEI